jgi:uncharacterized protein involved in outer membrane biogenesis
MTRRRILIVLAAILLTPVVLVGVLALAVRSEWAERRVESMVSAKLEREVQLEGLSFTWGWPPGVVLERLRIGNPSWAKTKNLVDAEGLSARVRLLPLFKGLFVVPYIRARKAEAGLEVEGEKATWRFGERSDEPSKLYLQRIYLDDGHIVYLDAAEKTELDVRAKGSAGEQGELQAHATGKFRGEPLKATARIPELATQHESPVRFAGEATIGRTKAVADGQIATDGTALDLDLKLSGASLEHLGKVTGIVFPETPPYNIAGHLRHAGNDWHFTGFKGRVGDSDLAGDVQYSKVKPRPVFKASLRSNLLDLDDLGPLIGAPPKTGPGETAAPEQKAKASQRQVSDRILPETRFKTEAWGKMDADVTLNAKRVQRPKQLPLDALQTHLLLRDSVLRLQPLNFTMAQGRVTSDITLDPKQKPMRGDIKMDVQGLQLKQMFPTLESMQDAFGTLYGRAELVGHGQTVADLLGTSDGKASFAVSGGRISALLVELLGLDVAESVMLLGRKHNQVELRCAVSGFEVKDGLASANDFVVDTSDTVIKVDGAISLKEERLDLETKPYPKDMSPLALRTPLLIKGPMKDPGIRPKAGPLAARVAVGAALGAIAPPLAALALIETGPGKDTDCGRLLAEAKAKGAVKKAG